MHFEISYQVSEDDFIRINTQFRDYKMRKRRVLNVILSVVLVLIAYLSYASDKADGAFAYFSVAILVYVILWPRLHFLRNLLYRRIYRSTPGSSAQTRLVFSEEQLERITDFTRSEIKWADFKDAADLPEYLLLMTGSTTFTAVPKKLLNTQQSDWIIKRITK